MLQIFRCKDVLRTCPFWSPPMKGHTTTLFLIQQPPWLPQPLQLLPCCYPVLQPLQPPTTTSMATTFISHQTVPNQSNYTTYPTLHSHHLHIMTIQPSLLTSLQTQTLPHHHLPLLDSTTNSDTLLPPASASTPPSPMQCPGPITASSTMLLISRTTTTTTGTSSAL